ncbi:MAG: hypothetical protein FJ119_00915 [Deltaproteobacteria bacterium]|nr:hypothetical protein [Deltaproteobacteria bacterium]
MQKQSNIFIPKYSFREPRRNLSAKVSRKNTERDFTISFARSYISQFASLHYGSARTEVYFSREIPINGYGIADFVALYFNPDNLPAHDQPQNVIDFIKVAKPILRAFELKISNWRKALMQAHRYRYFANVSIVVLPDEALHTASRFIETFKTIKVGLWGFSQGSGSIKQLYTPRPSTPLEPKYIPRAIQLVAKASKFQLSA